jgi:hypothetical protein
VRNGSVVLTHGYSRVVLTLLQRAVAQVGGGGRGALQSVPGRLPA